MRPIKAKHIFLTTLVLISAACTHQPEIREHMAARSQNDKKYISEWDKGKSLTEDGVKMVKKGEHLIAQGEKKIQKGNAKITQGNSLMRHSESAFWDSELEQQRYAENTFAPNSN